jgi:hypothetical protein
MIKHTIIAGMVFYHGPNGGLLIESQAELDFVQDFLNRGASVTEISADGAVLRRVRVKGHAGKELHLEDCQ